MIASLTLAVFLPAALGCGADKVAVSYAQGGNKGIVGFFDVPPVQSHLEQALALEQFEYRQDGHTTLGCVDARSDLPQHGTPGGDLAEFAIGLTIYNRTGVGKVDTKEKVRALFQQFIRAEVSAERPFYYHTDKSKLQMVFDAVGPRLNPPRTISIFPLTTPPDSEKEIWLEELVKSIHQGCGHIRLMIADPVTYGLTSADIIQWTIRAYYEEYWASTISGKAKFDLVLKLGPLQGKGIAIMYNSGPACSGYSPAVSPNVMGSSLFVYHPTSAGAFRENVMTPFFKKQDASINEEKFSADENALFTTQLVSTLTLLDPAKDCSLFVANVDTSGQPQADVPTNPSIVSSAEGRVGALSIALAIGAVLALL